MNKELTIKSIEDVLTRFLTLDQYKDKRYEYGKSRTYNTYDIAEEIYNTVTNTGTNSLTNTGTNSLTNTGTNSLTNCATKAGTKGQTNPKTKKK